MKFNMQAFLTLCGLSSPAFTMAGFVRGSNPQHHSNREAKQCIQLKSPCTYLKSGIAFADGRTEERRVCQLHPEDLISTKLEFASFDDELELETKTKNVISGESNLYARGMKLCGTRLTIPLGAELEISTEPKEMKPERKMLEETTKGVLVVRIQYDDNQLPSEFTEAKASDAVFGTDGDSVNLKSQMEACSYGQVNIEPFSGKVGGFGPKSQISNGVYTVTIKDDIDGKLLEDAVEQVTEELRQKGIISDSGNPIDGIDHIMYAFPFGSLWAEGDSLSTWVAAGNTNHWLTMFNVDYSKRDFHLIQDTLVQAHEIGHNWGLDHSGEGNDEYGDRTGLMSNLNAVEGWTEDPNRKCFNGAKSWELGWYSDKHYDYAPSETEEKTTLTLLGISDYEEASDAENVIVRIESKTENYYVSFNRAAGINADTDEGQNQVLVTKATNGSGQKSSLLAKLDAGNSFTLEDSFYEFGVKGFTIEVDSIDLGSTPAKATISLQTNHYHYLKLQNDLSDSAGGQLHQGSVTLPEGATFIYFQISGFSGDADLYVKYGEDVGTEDGEHDCAPYEDDGITETCKGTESQTGTCSSGTCIGTSQAGVYNYMIEAYSDYSGLKLSIITDATLSDDGTTTTTSTPSASPTASPTANPTASSTTSPTASPTGVVKSWKSKFP